jgi:hypothetical protein
VPIAGDNSYLADEKMQEPTAPLRLSGSGIDGRCGAVPSGFGHCGGVNLRRDCELTISRESAFDDGRKAG